MEKARGFWVPPCSATVSRSFRCGFAPPSLSSINSSFSYCTACDTFAARRFRLRRPQGRIGADPDHTDCRWCVKINKTPFHYWIETRKCVTSHRTQGTSCSHGLVSPTVPAIRNQNLRHFFGKVFRGPSCSSTNRLMLLVKSSLLARSLCTCNTTAWLRRAWVIEERR